MMPAHKNKTVYLNHVAIGSAANWGDVSLVLSAALDRDVRAPEAMKRGIEGPDFFYITMSRLDVGPHKGPFV
jgi:hypothetical protein